MKRLALTFLAATLVACAGSTTGDNNTSTNNGSNNGDDGVCEDFDGDGFDGRGAACPSGIDCDDRSAQVNPGAPETCGDRRDNNCDGQVDEGCNTATECIDLDGDRYGQGSGCFGPDCDDSNMAIHPGAMEICGNNIDEDCQGGDLVCPTNCTDADGDGYGAAGSTDCMNMEIDCNDNNAAINPSANETCDNGVDNDCDGEVDECPLAGQACAGNVCQGGADAECENHDDCAGQFLRCDASKNPKICKVAENGMCNQTADCVDGLTCVDGVCDGNFCASDPCASMAPYDVCDRDGGSCVECPFFDPDPTVQDAACSDGEQCVPGGWCAYNYPVEISGFDLMITAPEEAFWINAAMAECWNFVRPEGEKDVCFAFFVSSQVNRVTEQIAEDAYVDGHIDEELFAEENEALEDIWGEGLFNRKEIDWKADLEPGTAKDVCLWYQPGSFLSGETLVLDKCENFVP